MVGVQVKARGHVVNDVKGHVGQGQANHRRACQQPPPPKKNRALEGHLRGHCHRLIYRWTRWRP